MSNNVYSIRAGTHVHFAGTSFPSYPPEDRPWVLVRVATIVIVLCIMRFIVH